MRVESRLVTVPFLLLLLVPVANAAAPILWIGCCAWVTGFGFLDYAMSSHGYRLKNPRRGLGRRRPLVPSFGGIAFAALLVSVLQAVRGAGGGVRRRDPVGGGVARRDSVTRPRV